MSTGKEIVNDASNLVNAVDELMQAQTTQKVVEIARKVNCGSAINAAVDTVDTPLKVIEEKLTIFRNLTAQLTGLSGILGLLQPLLAAGGQLVTTSGDQLQSIGLAGSGLDEVKSAVSLVTDNGEKILYGGEAVINNYPDKADVEQLIQEFSQLRQTIQGFKQEVGSG